MASDIKSVIYTDDYGKAYNVGIDAAVFSQVGVSTSPKVGGADYTGTPRLDPMPRNLRPRAVYVSNGTRKRAVICLSPDADLFTGVETTVNLTDGAGVSSAYSVGNHRAEKFRFMRNPAG